MPCLVLTSLAVALALSQAVPTLKPDFSGTWAMDRSRSQSSESATLTITHTANEISIETFHGGSSSTKTYPIEMSPHAATEAIATGHAHARWDGSQLITEIAGEIQGQTVSYKQTRSLNAAGTEMTVESIVIVHHGYSIEGSKNYSTAKDIYVRSK